MYIYENINCKGNLLILHSSVTIENTHERLSKNDITPHCG